MSSSSRGSGPERRGSRRQRVAGSRGRPQSRAREPESQEPGDQGPESQEPGDQGPESQEPGDQGPGSEVGQPGEPEEADTGAADATSGAGDPDAGRAEDPESGTAETGDAEDDSDSSPGEDPATEQVAQLPADGSDAQHSGASDSASDDSTGGSVDEDGADEDGAVEDAETPQRGRFGLRMAMLAAAAVLAGFGAWFAYETITLHTSGAAANDALVDAGATSEVNGQVGEAVTKLFSYNFAEADKADAAADELLVGPAVDKYNELWGVLRKQAPEQKLVVDTAVKSSAVTWLQGDRAEVLLYVDQKATRAGNEEGQNEPAQLTVGAEKHGDQWKINRISLR